MKWLDSFRKFWVGGNKSRFDESLDALDEIATGMEELAAPPVQEPPPSAIKCEGCSGYFSDAGMKRVVKVIVIRNGDNDYSVKATVDFATYCKRCAPSEKLRFEMYDSKRNLIDERAFRFDDMFQEVDLDTGENRYILDEAEFSRLYCMECGDYLRDEDKPCKDCAPQKKTPRKGKK